MAGQLKPHMLVGMQTRYCGVQTFDTGVTSAILGSYSAIVSVGGLLGHIARTYPVRRNLASLYALKYQSGEKVSIMSVMTASKAPMEGGPHCISNYI